MGKQSKRKNKGSSKKAHKEKVQERRERVIQAIDGQTNEDKDDEKEDRIELGDRVFWFAEGMEWRRAVVRAITVLDSGETEYTLLPVEAPDRQDCLVTLRTDDHRDIFRDRFEWRYRFDVGDKVYIYGRDAEGECWLPATVTKLWPTETDARKIYHYECLLEDTCRLQLPEPLHTQMVNIDDTIERPTSFRFSEGDEVIINLDRAVFSRGNVRRQGWGEGKILKVDCSGRSDYYAVYECSLMGRNKREYCLVLEDVDEHIAGLDATPRQRLLDSIDQNCSYQHIDFLVKSHNLDVAGFRELPLSRAIESGNHNALLWLQENLNVVLTNVRDEKGSGLLHQIAKGPRAFRFFDAALDQNDMAENKIDFSFVYGDEDNYLLSQRNCQGQLWLHELVVTRNLRVFSLLCLPGQSLAPNIARSLLYTSRRDRELPAVQEATKDNNGMNLHDVAKSLGHHEMIKMVDEFASWLMLYEIAYNLSTSLHEERLEASKMLTQFGQEPPSSVARRLVRLFPRLEGAGVSLDYSIVQLAEKGNVSVLSWLIEADPSIAYQIKEPMRTNTNFNEFVQREMYDKIKQERPLEDMDLVSLAAHGKPDSIVTSQDEYWKKGQWRYKNTLSWFVESKKKEGMSLEEYLEAQLQHSSGDFQDMLEKHRLDLLRDDELLENRLRLLNYLVKEHGLSPPNVVDIIRWRQCGVLRWLTEEHFIDLRGLADSEEQIIQRVGDVHFIGKNGSLRSMETGHFLFFAAIEFDDLQTIQWLVEDRQLPVSAMSCNGWNVLHACAYFGRTEIAHCLLTSCSAETLVKEPCRRKPWDDFFVAHLAIAQGFTFLADLFLEWGCPAQDKTGRSIDRLAKRSPHGFVKEWGQEKEKPLILEKAIRKLVTPDMESVEDVKQHIVKSKCLDFERWTQCGYCSVDASGPLGMTFWEVVEACCSKASVNIDFVTWLCENLAFLERDDAYLFFIFWGRERGAFKRQKASDSNLRMLAAGDEGGALARCLGKPWIIGISYSDPLQNPMIERMLHKFRDDEAMTKGLKSVCYYQVRKAVLSETLSRARLETFRLLSSGSGIQEIVDTAGIVRSIASELYKDESAEFRSQFDYFAFSPDGRLNLECSLHCRYDKGSPLRWQMLWHYKRPYEYEQAYAVFAAEGYEELILWSLDPENSDWDANKEIDVTRIAAYRGHTKVLDIFLERQQLSCRFSSNISDRIYAAILGAAESGRISDLDSYFGDLAILGLPLPLDALFTDAESESPEDEANVLVCSNVASSLVGSAVYGCLSGSEDPLLPEPIVLPSTAGYALLKWIRSKADVNVASLLKAMELVLDRAYEESTFERGVDLFKFLVEEMGLNVWTCAGEIHRISKQYISVGERSLGRQGEDRLELDAAVHWLELLCDVGLEIQSLKCSSILRRQDDTLALTLEELQSRQRKAWSNFDVMKKGEPLLEIQKAVENRVIELTSRDSSGLLLIHLAAAYDRLDVLKWLVDAKMTSLNLLDGLGRTVLEAAKASNAVSCVQWIARREAAECIASFLWSSYLRRIAERQKRALLHLIKTVQAWYRGYEVRQAYRGQLLTRLEDAQRFRAIWDRSLILLEHRGLGGATSSWTYMKQKQHDTVRTIDPVDEIESNNGMASAKQVLGNAASGVVAERILPEKDAGYVEANEAVMKAAVESDGHITEAKQHDWGSSKAARFDQIRLTKEVLKWLRIGDSKYREFFIRRLTQLAAGDRSRILAKRLTGSKSVVYETYLEQKSGHRILWTEDADYSLLIWYVAKHKEVSRLLGLIDDAESRSSRQLTSASTLPELEPEERTGAFNNVDERVMLDPLGDTPLKLYEVHSDEISKLNDPTWEPPLHLSTREREVVETPGTVLLLGRSGTGKTVCICNRMDYDQHTTKSNLTFSQLFVARSEKLRHYVEEAVSGSQGSAGSKSRFTIFNRLVQTLESSLPDSENASNLFLPSQRMDYSRFKREVWKPSVGVDSLIVWTNIRSFIKGSIESVLQHKPLEEAEYLCLGKRRCRLSPEQRKSVYEVFGRYKRYMEELKLWDDCDRITALLRRLEEARKTSPFVYEEVCYSKIYVDEVQDYTQAEIALFFYLSGPGSLFLAGDPAQSVVEGVEFRFEEVRSVGHHLFGKDRRSLIPDKPQIVNVNFRSHSGILDVAAGILQLLFGAFPDAAKQLKKDRGVFSGPRPAVFHRVDLSRLRNLVTKLDGVVVLTHDKDTAKLKHDLGYPLVYGIREAKGLEFYAVIMVNFSGGLPSALQKPLRDLLLGRDSHDISAKCPEIEGLLKLLYTGTTRCIQRLFFAETTKSISGDSFVRWITTTKGQSDKDALAVSQSVDDIETMTRTPDEWRSAGLDNAVMAESAQDPESAERWLEKAIYCFEQIGDTVLARKARTHRSSARFRSELESSRSRGIIDAQRIELDAAHTVERLLAEQELLLEVKQVVEDVSPLLIESSRNLLQQRFVSKLSLLLDERTN